MKKKTTFYSTRRHWYHLSTKLERYNGPFLFDPYGPGENREATEPEGERICVAPSLAHCLTALPQSWNYSWNIYRTVNKITAKKPNGIFDADITKEGWLLKPTKFVFIGKIDSDYIETLIEDMEIPPDGACSGFVKESKKSLKRWKKLAPKLKIDTKASRR